MAALIQDIDLSRRLIAERRRLGHDRWDEVWEGVYVMNPLPNDEHQEIQLRLGSVLLDAIDTPRLGKVRGGVNVSDREADWDKNFRCPDVVVFLNDTKAVNHGSFWYGGPDFAVEIVSPGDRSREKLHFYSQVGTRELLLVDREPWSLELYRHDGNRLVIVGTAMPDASDWLTSAVVPLKFRLVTGESRPEVEIVHSTSQKQWRI